MSTLICRDSDGNFLKTLYQWDSNQTITVSGVDMPPIPVFHFCNRLSKKALVVSPVVAGSDLVADIPNILLQQAEPIIVYLYEDTDDDGYRTAHVIHIPVIPRPEPDDYEYEENIDYISVAVLNSRVTELLHNATSASEAASALEVIDIRTGYDGTVYDTAGDAVRALGAEMGEVKEELEQYVNARAVDGLYYENSLLYLTSNGEVVSDPVEIVNGSGTPGPTSIVRIASNNENNTFSVVEDGDAILSFAVTSTVDDVPTGDISLKIQVNGATKLTTSIQQGQNEVNVKNFLSAGANTVRVTCTDTYGAYRTLVYTISVVQLKITSTFDDTVTYNDDITFKYTPYGAVEKTVHMKVDGTEVYSVTTTSSGKQSTKVFSAMEHGVHRLDVYMTATMNGANIESEHLIYDIMCTETGNNSAFIASPFTTTSAGRGDLLSIPYSVYDPDHGTCEITLTVYTLNSGSRVVYGTPKTITVDRTRQVWNTRRYPQGTVYFEIAYATKSVSKTHPVTVTESQINIEPVSNDLELALLASGRSNGEATPNSWTSGEVTTSFSNVNWKSTGWIEDTNGDTALHLAGGATAAINFKPFATDLRTTGKTIEVEFAIRDVNNRDAVVMSCLSGGIGFTVTADTATLKSEQTTVFCKYRDEEKLRVAFVIESRNEYRLLSIYLNGVLSGIKQYPTNDNFQQSSPANITIGSQYCAVDVYAIRSYSTALSALELVNNYIADISDIADKIAAYNNNDIYNEYNALSYTKLKPKIPVMTIVGSLPQSKGDKKNVTIIYEDPVNPELNFQDGCKIDVQGTSSQWYVRKNWKLKFNSAHQHAPGMMPAKTFCMKVDYAEATGTHNTQNANFVDTLYTDTVPPQEEDEQIRTAIYGFPCVIFHQEDVSSDPVFYGKANFNYDKGAENVFGFTNAYDVECWEFKNNTSDVCNFNAEMPEDWSDDFEARYPEDNEDISRLSDLISWVYSTKNDLETFKDEFEDYFNLNYVLVYYVYTFLMLMVDQRAKNMMLTYWDETGKWYPYFYDNDTCLGINNEGELVFDYYHEDTDQISGANVYNGQNSILWNNVRQAYANEIKALYQSLRNSGKITYDKLYERFITKGSDQWSESVYNEDAIFKYVSMAMTDNDTSNLYQVRGDGESHFKYFMKNRLDYCDSKWDASDYKNDYVSLRIYTPNVGEGETLAVEPNADITVIPFSNMYCGVKYKAEGTLQQTRAAKNTEVTFTAPNETFNDTETAIYGASNLSSLGDLAPLYCGSINVSKASKLVNLKIGDSTNGYSNPNLRSLSVGTNRLLKTIDIRNCPNLVDPLVLSGCPNIENVYASGSGITSVSLPDGGYLKVLHLPETVKNLTIKNQPSLHDFDIEGTDVLETLWIENCPFDTLSFIEDCEALKRLRIVGIDWDFEDATFLKGIAQNTSIGGMDETGANTSVAYISGTVHIDSLTGADYNTLRTAFPHLTIDYDSMTSTVFFMSADGDTQISTSTVTSTTPGTGATAIFGGTQPTKEPDAQYTYTFDGWSNTIGGALDGNALLNVEGDRTLYAHFAATIRDYNVYFYNGSTVLQVKRTPYGGTAVYDGTIPTKSGVSDPENYEFIGWSPSPANITGNVYAYARYSYNGSISDTWATISARSLNGTAANYYSVGDSKKIRLSGTVGTNDIDMDVFVFILGIDHNSTFEGAGVTFSICKIYTDDGLYDSMIPDRNHTSPTTDGALAFNMNHWGNNSSGGWAGCDLRYDILGSTDVAPSGYGSAKNAGSVGADATSTCATNPVANTLMSCLPSDLRAVMKPMTIYSNNYGSTGSSDASHITASVDYLPLLSEYEVYGSRTYADENEQSKQDQYSYYSAGNAKKRGYGQYSNENWWLRSVVSQYGSRFCSVNNAGDISAGIANNVLTLSPIFRV